MQKIVCINKRKVISKRPQIFIGQAYYLETSSVNGDFNGDWYGEIYADENKSEYIGHLKLSRFKSFI